MNDLAMLERRYRWLLRWYPPSFRNDNEDEVLGVLMTLVTYPEPATLLAGAVYLLETAALLTSPGPRLGRRHGGHLGVLMVALLYPYAIEFASLVFGRGSYHDLLRADVTPLHLAILFLLPLVMAALAVLIAVRGRLASSPDAGLTPGS